MLCAPGTPSHIQARPTSQGLAGAFVLLFLSFIIIAGVAAPLTGSRYDAAEVREVK